MTRILSLVGLAVAAFGTTYLVVIGLAENDKDKAPRESPPGMVWIPGGEFTMGTDGELGWPDEKPAHRVRVPGFFMDEAEVTNAQFAEFVKATKYLTTAEKAPDAICSSPPAIVEAMPVAKA